MRLSPLLVCAALLAGCSAAATTTSMAPATTSTPATSTPAQATWTDGMVLRGAVTVPAGSTLTLAPGATVTAAQGSSLIVAGRLLAPAGGTLTGSGWQGVTVARGGSVDLRGLTVSGAGLSTRSGAGAITLRGGRITGAATPLSVADGTTVTADHLAVSRTGGPSFVKGTLAASHLTYDQGGNAGFIVDGTVRISDSLLMGNGQYDGDMLTTTDAKEVTVRRTEVRGVHCAFHLAGVGALALDGLDIHGNAYGFMAYGSATNVVHHITDTDVYDNRDFGLYESPGTVQGRIVVDGGYWGHNGSSAVANLSQVTGKVERTHPAASR